MAIKLSTYFEWHDVDHSETADRKGINNELPVNLIPAVQYTALQMDKVRKVLNRPILVSSWYRCPQLNAVIGGSSTSQHTKGEALDFKCPSFGSPYEVVKALAPYCKQLQIDQLIWEGTWVHISFAFNRPARNQILSYDSKSKKYSLFTQGESK